MRSAFIGLYNIKNPLAIVVGLYIFIYWNYKLFVTKHFYIVYFSFIYKGARGLAATR